MMLRPLYIDPGSGALVMQMLLAAAAGILFWALRPVRWISRRLKRKKDV